MAAGPLERHAIAQAADAAARDVALLAAVDGDELLDPILVLALAEQELDAAEIALAFLADVADKQHVARRLELRRLHGADDGQHQRDAARVVADARRGEARALALDLDVGAFGKHGVDVREDRQHRPAGRSALAHAHGVPFGVDLDIGETRLAQHLDIRLRPRLFLEGRRRESR